MRKADFTTCRKMQKENNKKNDSTNLVIATPIKTLLTPDKSSAQGKNKHQKGKQTAAQIICKKAHNLLTQHRSKPGQRDKQDFCKTKTPDQNFLK